MQSLDCIPSERCRFNNRVIFTSESLWQRAHDLKVLLTVSNHRKNIDKNRFITTWPSDFFDEALISTSKKSARGPNPINFQGCHLKIWW